MFKPDESETFEDLFRTLSSFSTTKLSMKMQDKPVRVGKQGGASPMDVDAFGQHVGRVVRPGPLADDDVALADVLLQP